MQRSIVNRFLEKGWVNTKFPSKAVPVATIANQYLAKILMAQVYEVAHETSLASAANLTSMLSNKVYLKREDTQPVFCE